MCPERHVNVLQASSFKHQKVGREEVEESCGSPTMSLTRPTCISSVTCMQHRTAPSPHRSSRIRRNVPLNALRRPSVCCRGVFPDSAHLVWAVVRRDRGHACYQSRRDGQRLSRGLSDARARRRRGDGEVQRLGVVRAQVGDNDEGSVSPVNGESGRDHETRGEEGESSSPQENGGFSKLQRAISRGTARYYQNFVKDTKTEAGVDVESLKERATAQVEALREKAGNAADVARERGQELLGRLERVQEKGAETVGEVRERYWPQFAAWNSWELWKDVKKWDGQRAGALVLYALLLGASVRGVYTTVTTPRLNSTTTQKLAEDYLEAVIPEPTEENLQKLKKGMWRDQMPEGFRAQKYLAGPDGEFKRDPSYVGENAWAESDDEEETVEQIVEKAGLTEEEKAELAELIAGNRAERGLDPAGTSASAEDKTTNGSKYSEDEITSVNEASAATVEQVESRDGTRNQTWQERLQAWDKLLLNEHVQELVDQDKSKFVVPINHEEIRSNLAEEKEEKELQTYKHRAFWVARRWWKYRPSLPYTYFLAKVESLEVEAAVYSCDMKKLYVTMKDGFPSEYVVDVPVDPFLYEALTKCGVETDILSKSNFAFYGRAFLALLPSVAIIVYIRAVQYRAKEKFSEKIYDLLKMNRRQLILPEDAADKAKSQYKDVIVGGDVWMVLEEIMTYMRDPMKYHNKRVKLPRGILLSGPPGTGKTLLARAIARESGLPFVFASGAEFVESSTGNGSDKIFDIFFTARANAPSFVFIDEIDALAGKNVNDDAERRATFQQLLAELDGEPEDTDIDRFSLRQAVVLICATNRPDELDESFVRPGRIDREIHIGLPGEEERISIFGVHSSGKPLAKDVDFRKLVYRSLGYSGADIRNLINEAGIMAVRNRHEEITQQDFIDVLDKQLFEGMGMSLTDDEQQRTQALIPEYNKRLLAVHEAGHILLAHLYPRFDWHAFTHLLPGGSEYALTVFYPRQEMVQQGHTTVGYLRMQMVVAHGGRCAERIMFGDDVSDGNQDDLFKITGIARELTMSLSNRRFGLFPMKWQDTLDPPKRPDEIDLIPNEWDKPGSQIVQMSAEFSELFTREVTKYIDETDDEAMEALQKNEHILRRLTEELLAKTKISGFEAEDIIRSMDPVMLPDPLLEPMNIIDEMTETVVPLNTEGLYEEMVIYPAPLHRG